MALRLISKGTINGYVIASFVDSGGFIKLNGNAAHSANTDGGGTITSMTISSIMASVGASANVTISRGATKVWTLGSGTHYFDFTKNNASLEKDSTERAAICVVTTTGAGGASVLIRFHKNSTISNY